MATRLAVLTLALLLGVLCAVSLRGAPRAGSSCATCHAPHGWTQASCASCHRGDSTTTRRDLAHAGLLAGATAAWAMPGSPHLAAGERLRDALGCRRCHVSGGTGNRLAIPLDDVVWAREPSALRRSIREPVTFMPDFSLGPVQIDQLIAVLLRDAERERPAARYLVRFRGAPPTSPAAFERHCGECHRALTPHGALGRGDSGPNLSGLFSAAYPVAGGAPWTRERLRRWVRNPRAERPLAIMPPRRLDDAELEAVMDVLEVDRAPADSGATRPQAPRAGGVVTPPRSLRAPLARVR